MQQRRNPLEERVASCITKVFTPYSTIEPAVQGVMAIISEARREEGEIVHKQMDEIMDKAIERARREERKLMKKKLCRQCQQWIEHHVL